jgi:hypothetical protein
LHGINLPRIRKVIELLDEIQLEYELENNLFYTIIYTSKKPYVKFDNEILSNEIIEKFYRDLDALFV